MNVTLAAIIFIIFGLVIAWLRITIRGASIKKQWWPLVVIVVLSWNVFVPLIRGGTYHGKVVDELSGDPLAGAVVEVIWYQRPIIHLAASRSFQRADETVTSKTGSFSVWTWPGISFNPFTYVLSPPDAIIYKAGYAPLSVLTAYERGYADYERLADEFKGGILVKLPKLKSKADSLRFVDLTALSILDVPHQKIPRLIREINVQRKSVGITSLYPELKVQEGDRL